MVMASFNRFIVAFLATILWSDQVVAFATLKRQLPGVTPPFNADQQLVSTSGAHAWIAPKASDKRGPCPGLNAAANHGYIPRNGIATVTEAATGLQAAWGMALDLGTALAVVGVTMSGDGIRFSIGGPPPPNLIAGGLLGQPLGISYSHNKFEGDSSPTRGDLYQFGNDFLLQVRFFQGMLDLPLDPDFPSYTLDVLGTYALTRFRQSVAENPYYLRGGTGISVPPGALGLVAGLFSNKSAEYPGGFLDAATLKSIFSITGESGSLVYTPGHERIPNNFYKRNPLDEYSAANFGSDLGQIYRQNPEALSFGGNTGTVNSFTPIDVGNLSGGLYNAQSLREGNNLACFFYQNTATNGPDLIKNGGVLNDVLGAVAKLNAALGDAINNMGCPQLAAYKPNSDEYNRYPGYTELRKSGTYP